MANHKKSNIFVGNSSLTQLEKFLKKKEYSSAFILVDENTHRFCLPLLIANCPSVQQSEIIEINSGEQNKNIEICSQIWATLSYLKADRNSVFINLGGGVICDMGGFIASTFKRGIDFIHIPTTLLAQVDASIGGKTGIDSSNIKNEIGLFSEPEAIVVLSDFIDTLDKRQIKSGLAEIIKHGLIADSAYWKKIKKEKNIKNLINESIAIKNKIVQKDYFEKNSRKHLNFGHTIGHAIESYFLTESSKPLLHGEAIAIGIICESYLSSIKLDLKKNELNEICDFIITIFGKIKINKNSFDALVDWMKHDKKNVSNKINCTLLEKIGKAKHDNYISEDEIKKALSFYSHL